MNVTAGLVATCRGVASRRQQALVQVGIEARHHFRGGAHFAQAGNGVLGGIVVRRHQPAAGKARFGVGHEPRNADGAALAVEFLGKLRDLRRRQQRVLLRGFEQRLGAIEVLRGEGRLDLRERGLGAHRVEARVDFDEARVIRVDAARSLEFGQRVVEATFVERGAGTRDQQAAEALETFGGLGVLRIEHQHLAEMFQGVVLGRFDVAALVHGEARLLEHFVERGRGLLSSGGRGVRARRTGLGGSTSGRAAGVGRLLRHEVPAAAGEREHADDDTGNESHGLAGLFFTVAAAARRRSHSAERVGGRGNSRGISDRTLDRGQLDGSVDQRVNRAFQHQMHR